MDMVCNGVTYVASLSDGVLGAVIGAVLGSGITLLGTWRQNAAARKQFEAQLSHEKAQAYAERTMQLRREIFMEGASWCSSVTTTMSNFPDVTRADAAPPVDFSVSPLRMAIVADEETIKCVN